MNLLKTTIDDLRRSSISRSQTKSAECEPSSTSQPAAVTEGVSQLVDDHLDIQRESARNQTKMKVNKLNEMRRLKMFKRHLNNINSLPAIKLKFLLLALAASITLFNRQLALAGFFTFYFPNIFKPKGFGELSDMIDSLKGQINETRDAFADTQYFWGQMQQLDKLKLDYPEESACTEIFPMFRDKAIEYTYIDFDHFIKPLELYKDYLIEFREKWYPAGLESKAALPREWEQKLLEKELELKIEYMNKLVNEEEFIEKRKRMLDIWKDVRRSLDTSLPCIYLRYAFRQIAEDINQVSLSANLEGMHEAMKLLLSALKRVEKFKDSDKKIIEDIEEEIKKVERFTIKT